MPKLAGVKKHSSDLGKIRDTQGQDTVRKKEHLLGSNRNRLLLGILGVAILLGILIPVFNDWSKASRSVNGERLRFATVDIGAFVRDVAVQGNVVAAVSPTVFATFGGVVTLMRDAGDVVKTADVLARIESPELTSQLAQETAGLAGLAADIERQSIQNRQEALRNQQLTDLAQVALTAAKRELRRAEKSWEHQVISLQDFEKAQDDVEKAELDFNHAEKAAVLKKESLDFELTMLGLGRDRQKLLVDNLQRRLDAQTLRSPVSGMVGKVSVSQREAVLANTAIMTVVDLSAFEIEANIPESYADDLGLGMDVVVTFSGKEYEAHLVSVSPEVQNNTVVGRIRFASGMPEGLRQNQRITSRIILERKDQALTVKRGAFLNSGGGRIAYVRDGNLLRKRTITTGSSGIGVVEILDGLEPGEVITVSSIEQFEGEETILITD